MTTPGISLFFLLLSFRLLAQEPADWLVEPVRQVAGVYVRGQDIVLDNGLVRRTFRLPVRIIAICLMASSCCAR